MIKYCYSQTTPYSLFPIVDQHSKDFHQYLVKKKLFVMIFVPL